MASRYPERATAADRGGGGSPRPHRRLTDGTVNQPATRRQLRILWRQVTRSFFGARSRARRTSQRSRGGNPSDAARHRGRIGKSALQSRGCGRLCPTGAVVSVGVHDKLEKAKKMHKFNRFGDFFTSDPALERPSCTYRSTAGKDLPSAGMGNETERCARFGAPTRAVMGGFFMQHPRALPATTLSADRKSRANRWPADRFALAGRNRSATPLGSGMGVASLFVIRVADPSAQPGNEEAI
jgi:hypothetical protein